jgi:Spy/CpxP family protein refolding chaperone
MKTFHGKRTVAVAALALFATVGSGVAVAQMAKGAWRGNGIAAAYQRILGRLDLSQDQTSQINALIASEKPVIQGIVQQLTSDVATLRATAAAASPDANAVGSAFLKVKSDRAALRAELEKLRQGTEAVLTPAQKGEFEAYLTTLRAMRRRFHPVAG